MYVIYMIYVYVILFTESYKNAEIMIVYQNAIY